MRAKRRHHNRRIKDKILRRSRNRWLRSKPVQQWIRFWASKPNRRLVTYTTEEVKEALRKAYCNDGRRRYNLYGCCGPSCLICNPHLDPTRRKRLQYSCDLADAIDFEEYFSEKC